MPRRSQNADNTPKALVEDLEKRQLMAADNIIGIRIAKRVDTDGTTALNSNRITIAFDKVVRLGDTSQFRSFGYANDTLNPNAQRKVTVNFTSIERDSTGKVLTLITDRLIRKGGRLIIYSGGLTDKNGNALVYDASTANKTITFTVGQNKPRYTLSNRNFKPTDLGYFSSDVFSGAPTPTTANVVPSEATVRPQLVAFLNAKVAATGQNKLTAAQRDEALAIFDDAGTKSLIPAANLRAGLVSLYGTVAQPAVLSYLRKNNVSNAPFGSINFASGLSTSVAVGETTMSERGRLNTLIRNEFSGEDFRALSAVLAHEILHQDTTPVPNSDGQLPSSQDEEIIANAVQTIVYMQQALIDSSFLANGTQLVTKINDQVLAMLNSGDRLFPYGGISQAPNINSPGNVFVGAKANPGGYGSSTVKSFEDWIRREYISRGFKSGGTSTNPTAQAILKNIVGSNTNVTLFGSETERLLDTQNTVLTDVNYIRMATALKLTF